jgi:hypothetical protein
VSFSTAAVTSIQVTDTTNKTGQSFSLSYGLPLSLSGSMSVSQIEAVVFGGELTVSGASGLSVTESQSIQVRAPLSTTGDPILFGARNGITITHPVITDGGNQTLDADKDADGVGTLTLDFPLKEFTDPNPNAGNTFGSSTLILPSGNVVITSPNDDAGGTDAGAVYLFNGMTGSLISTLRGSSASDQVGITGLVRLTNGNYVVRSSNWDSGAIANVGAVTWGNGTSGISGVVSSSNSLVGSSLDDAVGSSFFDVVALSNGNYVVRSSSWDSGAIANVGAVTWGNGTSGISGVVSSSNSLVGSSASDTVGSTGVTALNNGNYVVRSANWASGSSALAVGAVTWGNGTSGISGVVSASNSLVGSKANDRVGSTDITALTNGNYVVRSANWDSGAIPDVGAVTWGNGTSGISGVVSSSNSLVGSRTNDYVGSTGATALTNGNYVVASSTWASGTMLYVGAVTWGNGTSGISGVVSSSNSLVGSTASDQVGLNGVTALTNGNYVVLSPNWASGTILKVGAVTWGNGSSGISGVVSASNSLVGSRTNDAVGRGVTALSNGNYVVRSSTWASGTILNVGAMTWGNGTSGISGVVSSSNSLVGSRTNDYVGSGGATALTNGNYVVGSSNWASGGTLAVGAVTWGNGTSGISGVVSSSNSLVGSSLNDNVGGYFGSTALLTNGNYVVLSASWDSGASNVGAVTWGNGTSGISGVVSASNSLVGSSPNDNVGTGLVRLTNGNYVVRSSQWDSGTITDVGSVTWGNGTSGISGVVSSSNSIVGQTANIGSSWSLTTSTTLDAFLASNRSDGSGRVVLGSSARGFSLPSTPAGSLQAANGSVALSVAGTNLQGTISSNADVTIAPSQTARQIDLGSKASGKLGLTDTELDRIAAANLRIGNASSGDLTVSSPISRTTSTAMQLTSGGAILLGAGAQSTNGAIHTAGGTLSLDAGTNINPATPGVDTNTSAFSFAAGDTLQIDITGATVDSQYGQLSITGPVTLTGVNLSLNVNFPGMTGTETFTIVNATGGITGQFSGLVQGGTISVGSYPYAANYTSNSVQLVPNVQSAPTITSGNAATFAAGLSESFQVVATGNPAASYSITSGSLPSGVTLNPSTGALSGKAAIGTVGSYPVTISASNGIGTPATQAFTLTVVSQLTSIQVSKGQAQRTYLRYIDLTMANASVATQLASNASTRIKLVKRDLSGNNPSDVSLTGLVSASGSTVAIDFGAAGIGGARNTNAADGYYALQFDLDSDGTFETTYNFFRLFGDTNGDGKVDQADVNNVAAGMTAYSAAYDLNFDGRVTSGDLILVRRALGRALNPSLPLG